MSPSPRRPEVSLYHRNARHITDRRVLHQFEKDAEIAAAPFLKRKKLQAEFEARWREEETEVAEEALQALIGLEGAMDALDQSFAELAALRLPELLGKVEAEQLRVRNARAHVETAKQALTTRDFGAAGAATDHATRELWLIGGPLIVALNTALAQAAIARTAREKLQANLKERKASREALEEARKEGGVGRSFAARVQVHALQAKGFAIAAEILGSQVRRTTKAKKTSVGREGGLRVIPPQELETFADVGGHEEVKEQLRNTIGAILERPDEAARYRVVHNGILFHGPPGTGKTLLGRALAGEYGLRYIRFNPASIASAYIHEAAANLQKLFELARDNTPCVLFFDEVDVIASSRDDQPSADHREVVTQLMNSLEEYRSVPGLVIVAATNNIDCLDPGLREGRFDAKILIPLPDSDARQQIIKVHLARRGDAVAWDTIDLPGIGQMTSGRNAAALESFVSIAAQRALQSGSPIRQEDLLDAIKQREGKDRFSMDERVTWEDVVLPDETREQVMEILTVFSRPDLARSLGVKPPAGILLFGPPGTGKTTIAKAMAVEMEASFYEQSAADLLSKWVGESEERVAKLFSKARANRPSIIFIDEIDSLLRTRSDDAAPWESRVVSQFLRELDGLVAGEGVLLVGATNRIDIIDPAIQGRRLTPVEIGLPDAVGRLKLLKVLCSDVSLSKDVDLKKIVSATEGMSGADLKRIRDAAGMKALNRVAKDEDSTKASITMDDLRAALESQRDRASLIQV